MEVLLPLSGHNIASSTACEKRVLKNFLIFSDIFLQYAFLGKQIYSTDRDKISINFLLIYLLQNLRLKYHRRTYILHALHRSRWNILSQRKTRPSCHQHKGPEIILKSLLSRCSSSRMAALYSQGHPSREIPRYPHGCVWKQLP